MSTPRRILLINPTITKRASARFPLAVLSLSAALDGRYQSRIIDGNVDSDFIASSLAAVEEGIDAVGISVMGGPQLVSALAVSRAIRGRAPTLPIIWGGHFPTICAAPALASPVVDYVVRGQGEETFVELLDHLFSGTARSPDTIAGLSWRSPEGILHNPNRPFSAAPAARSLPYERLGSPDRYLGRTYLGRRTSGYQAALGCRFRCTFCGVAAMFRGKTALPPVARLERDLDHLSHRLGVDSVLFYDHNFFDREEEMEPLLATLARHRLPWWCFARSDALINLSERSWALVRKANLRMAYIGAESPSDALLHEIRKGTHTEQTLEVVERCRHEGVIPELSFMLAPPQDPEGETERTFDYIRRIKRLHPATEIMLYLYAPMPPPPVGASPHVEAAVSRLRGTDGTPLIFPATAEMWAEPQWVRYWCHTDTPWVSERLRERIRDFTTVLGCRFPTVTDVRSPAWGKRALKTLASWRYRSGRYERPWELDVSRRFIRLWDPKVSGL